MSSLMILTNVGDSAKASERGVSDSLSTSKDIEPPTSTQSPLTRMTPQSDEAQSYHLSLAR